MTVPSPRDPAIPWELEISNDPDVLPAWVARYPGHGTYWFVGWGSTLTFESEDGSHERLSCGQGSIPGTAAKAVIEHMTALAGGPHD